MPIEPLTLRAHAKVNLALAVGAPEPADSPKPGYHRIASWFACVGLHDDVTIEPRPSGPSAYTIEWAEDAPRPTPIDWPVDQDLGVRAHRALERVTGQALPVGLRVRKRIPVGGGLGGGSSDAAAVLLGVNRALGLGLTTPALRAIAQTLGSDIVYFLGAAEDDRGALPAAAPQPALVEGFGELITPLTRVHAMVVLFFPPFGCPTGEVYRAFDAQSPPPVPLDGARVRALTDRVSAGGPLDPGALFNDLAAPAEAVRPALRALRARLSEHLGVPVHVTGSGSTLFAVAADAADAAHAHAMAAMAARLEPSLAAVATTLL